MLPLMPDDERELFEAAMADVAPIERDRHLPHPIDRRAISISEREREALRELDGLVAGEGQLELQDTDDLIEGRVPGLDPRVVKQLRKGEFTVQSDLDLHGMTAEEARGLVERFITGAHARGLRCLRIVHGKGRGSPGGVPVIKASLPRWLARGPARRIVLAYTSAPPHDGGSGATYVLLRKQR
jgi:DNA-nicking Smr family endonuclease